ncbi:MAG: homoserine O-acetyltransferase [Bacillota bacterium]|jgi:homoserine O-acetyltransferase|nr:homoserine O-acetyltransferase [Bacillota bacterium]
MDRHARNTLSIGSFQVECGAVLPEVTVAYETWGTLSPERDNVVLVCHALTGDARAARTPDGPGWWEGLIGPGRYIDTNRYFVIASNVLGGCYGTTGPSSLNPATGKPYGSAFPPVTIRDMVRVQARLLDALGIERVLAVVGGSMGGMQVLEWGVMYPDRVGRLIPMATAAYLSATAIAYNDIGRQAILADPNWRGGDYYPGPGPEKGLSIARMVGMVTYRSAALFDARFGRNVRNGKAPIDPDVLFEVESYLRYQGEKLVRRFDANTYLLLLRAMDTHDIGRDRGGLDAALSRIAAPVLFVGITEDLLYPPAHLRELAERLRRMGKDARMVEISTPYGHDGFLVEFDKIGPHVRAFLAEAHADAVETASRQVV